MKNTNYLLMILGASMLVACQRENKTIQVTVTNDLDFARSEVVAIKNADLISLLSEGNESQVFVKPTDSEEYLRTQWIDNDLDGSKDELLFLAELTGKGSKVFVISVEEKAEQPTSEVTTFSRIVPERTDDYTWENDRVAFRTFGPDAQRRIEENEPGGTLSSGIDLWLKKVNYSIIDKWYAGNDKEPGFYHIDHGEGYDPYHVGKSRGTGGLGVWENDTLITSKNFRTHKTITTGPLRTVFELDYAPWSDYQIEETKRVTLDLGTNFSKFEVTLTSNHAPNYTIGIQTHERVGEAKLDSEKGSFRYWEPMHQNFLGEGIVIDPAQVENAFVHESSVADQTQIMIVTKAEQQVLTYYAGFGWTEGGQVKNVEEWDEIMTKQTQILKSPLKVHIK